MTFCRSCGSYGIGLFWMVSCTSYCAKRSLFIVVAGLQPGILSHAHLKRSWFSLSRLARERGVYMKNSHSFLWLIWWWYTSKFVSCSKVHCEKMCGAKVMELRTFSLFGPSDNL